MKKKSKVDSYIYFTVGNHAIAEDALLRNTQFAKRINSKRKICILLFNIYQIHGNFINYKHVTFLEMQYFSSIIFPFSIHEH